LSVAGHCSAAHGCKLAQELLEHHRTHAGVLAQSTTQRRVDRIRWVGGDVLPQHGCRVALEKGLPGEQLMRQRCQVVDQ
jgi:hypothetical protein